MALLEWLADYVAGRDITIIEALDTLIETFKFALLTFYENAVLSLFNEIYESILSFFNGTWFDFSTIGRNFVVNIDKHGTFEFFTHDFCFWFIGVLFAVFIIRFVFGFIQFLISIIK